MAMIDMTEPLLPQRERARYVRAPRPIVFPSEEMVPETKRHLEARTTLYLLLKDAFPGHAIGSEQFVYYDASDPKKCLAPDLFVKRGAREEAFDIWKIWERGAPELAVEIVSRSDRRDADWDDKIQRYHASGVSEVVRFDPEDEEPTIRVWDRVEEELLERVPDGPEARKCETLGLWWVIAPSSYGPMLRLARDPEGRDLLPTPSEEREAAQAENERLRAEIEKLRGERR